MRIARFAFDYAIKNGRQKVTAVHKANIMSVLFAACFYSAFFKILLIAKRSNLEFSTFMKKFHIFRFNQGFIIFYPLFKDSTLIHFINIY